MPVLPSGTVTLVMTDIEGSTRLLDELGDAYSAVLGEHRRILRGAFTAHGGVEVDSQGDALFFAFPRASDAISAAADGQGALADGPVRVRMGIHTGEPILTDEGYVGMDVHRVARIMAAGHGGQVLISDATVHLVADGSVTDLGAHRLKDLTAAQHLYQLGDEQFAPLRTLHATNLPVASNALFGREIEVGELIEIIGSGARVVTVTGTGGIGKTRLALQVASEMVGRYRDGVFWIPLAHVTDPALVMPEIGRALGIQGDVSAYLGSREMLLLLDNMEQLLAAAPGLGSLAEAAPKCTLLVSSRAPLRLMAEREYPLQPLSQSAAVTLFLERARAVGSQLPPSDAVAAICRKLDALPLAIELAAARTKLLDPAALRDRLDRRLPLLTGGPSDAPERQRTLRATIEWSLDLLSADARRLFSRLSVFAGGATVTSAETVCATDLQTLGVLVDVSLVTTAGGRLLMLETLREFAADLLTDAGEAQELRRRHAEHYLDQAERAEAGRWQAGTPGEVALQIEAEAANLRAAVEWAARDGEAEVHARLVRAAFDVFLHGSNAWVRNQIEVALASDPNDNLRAILEAYLSLAAYRLGDNATARAAGSRSLTIAENVGDRRTAATARNHLAMVDAGEGRFDAARRHLELALEDSRSIDDRRGVVMSLANLSDQALMVREYERGTALALEAVATVGTSGDPHLLQTAHLNAATGFVCRGRFGEAESSALEGLRFARQLDSGPEIEGSMRVLALVAVGRGQLNTAARLAGLVDRMRSELDAVLEPTERLLQDALTDALADLDVPTLEAEKEVGRRWSLDEALTAR